MDVFIQLFSSSAVLFLLVLGVISSSHAKEICSSARDGRCVLSSAVGRLCGPAPFILLRRCLHRWNGVPSRKLLPKGRVGQKRAAIFPAMLFFLTFPIT